MGLVDIPAPPPRHKRKTMKLVREADDGARELTGLPLRRRRRHRGKYNRRTGTAGLCVGCSKPYSENTPGCTNCYSRHFMREHDRAMRQPPPAEIAPPSRALSI